MLIFSVVGYTDSERFQMRRGIHDMSLIDFLGNLRHSIALYVQAENIPHYLGGFFVYNPVQLVLRVFNIPVWWIRAEWLPRLPLCFENGSYLPACVLGVELVENVDERQASTVL